MLYSNVNLFIFLLFSKDDRSGSVIAIVMFNKNVQPYAGPFQVGECPCAGVGPRRSWNIQV